MRPSARVQAAIELLDAVIDAAKSGGAPADRLISNYFRERRYAGSKDRRAVRELVYGAIRVCGDIPTSGRSAMLALAEDDASLRDLFDGEGHGPAPLDESDKASHRGVVPGWLADRFATSDFAAEHQAHLMERAPLDIRVNTLKADHASIDWPQEPEVTGLPHAFRLPHGTQVEQWEAYRDGAIEVQDLGSQAVCDLIAAKSGETVIDLCAGAGGKTLSLAAQMDNAGQIIACDTDRGRLSKLEPRARRAGVTNTQTLLLNPGRELDMLEAHHSSADLVLIDAPCSGTGTLRRKPEAKWRLTPQRLDEFASLQDRLLDIAAALTKPGGRIAFVTCSLLDEEGADRIAAFLARHEDWESEPLHGPLGRPHYAGYRLDPYHDGTDGFFVASLRSAC